MPAPLLRRLLEPSGPAKAALNRRRWCSVSSGAGPGGDPSHDVVPAAPSLWSSGRRAAPGLLLAERLDDGLLVAATADLPDEPIVWVGDVAVSMAVDEVADHGTGAAGLAPPRIRLGAVTPRVELVWATEHKVAHVECNLPCRPAAQRTFENEGLDPRVELEATEHGSVARLRPYPGLPAITIRFNGEASLEGPAAWSPVEVLDRDGPVGAEDRFSPGTFLVRLPAASSSLRMTVEVEGTLAPIKASGEVEALDPSASRERLMDVLAAPGLALESAWTPDQVSGWVGGHALAACAAIRGTGGTAEDDIGLWFGRACQLLLRNLRAGWGPLTYRGLVEDCFIPTIRGLVDAVLEEASSEAVRPDAAEGHAPTGPAVGGADRAPCPGVARFRGARRWHDVLTGAERGPGDAVAVETGALLHQLFVFEEQLCRMGADEVRADAAAARALQARRWFQQSYWLSTPRRLADREVGQADPVGGAALIMGPGMLLAASLEGAPLDQAQRRAVVRAVDDRLLTPFGLRALDRADRGFRQGSPSDGVVWPWLLGPHAEAAIRAFGRDSARLEFQETLLASIDGAPEVWAEGADGEVSPLGDLDFTPARGESIRAFRLLSEVLGEALDG